MARPDWVRGAPRLLGARLLLGLEEIPGLLDQLLRFACVDRLVIERGALEHSDHPARERVAPRREGFEPTVERVNRRCIAPQGASGNSQRPSAEFVLHVLPTTGPAH
jgi:hypothetical protein